MKKQVLNSIYKPPLPTDPCLTITDNFIETKQRNITGYTTNSRFLQQPFVKGLVCPSDYYYGYN